MSKTVLHALLIEDKAEDVRLIEAALARAIREGYLIKRVTSLSEALAVLGRTSFAIILLDLELPDAQGVAVVQQVARAAANTPIVILSSAENEDVSRLAEQDGADDYFVKALPDRRP